MLDNISHGGRLVYNWPISDPSFVFVCVFVHICAESHHRAPNGNFNTSPMRPQQAYLSLAHIHTHTAMHITAELIKHNTTGWEQDRGKKKCVWACGGISRSARWERDRGVNSDSSDAEKRWRGSERRNMENLSKKKKEKKGESNDKRLNWNDKSPISIHSSICMAYTSNCNAMQSEMYFIMLIFCTFTAAL